MYGLDEKHMLCLTSQSFCTYIKVDAEIVWLNVLTFIVKFKLLFLTFKNFIYSIYTCTF